jgi:CO/xanthine dehydrogenase Mo-binding subunit
MGQMIRKQVYIEPIHEANLKKQAKMLGITEAEVIRRAIDRSMALLAPGVLDLSAWEREKAFIAKRMAGKPLAVGRKFSREEAYEERLKRYGR